MNTHTCIKPACGKTYEDKEPDAYYCPSCVEEKRRVAKMIDAKLASVPRRETKSALQEYNEAQKIHGFMRAN